MRLVIDPGVLVAAALSSKASPAKLVRLWLGGAFELVVCPHLLDELRRVLLRNRFRTYLSVQEAWVYVGLFEKIGTPVPDPLFEPGLTPDANDDYLVALARACRADALVSGDSDLTESGILNPVVLTPRQAVERLDDGE